MYYGKENTIQNSANECGIFTGQEAAFSLEQDRMKHFLITHITVRRFGFRFFGVVTKIVVRPCSLNLPKSQVFSFIKLGREDKITFNNSYSVLKFQI